MKKKINIKLLKIERKIKHWMFQHRFRIYLFLVLGPLILTLPSVSYLNLLIEFELSVFLVFVLGLLTLDLSFKQIFLIVVLMFLIALFLFLLDEPKRAEKLGNYIYGVLLVWVLKEVFKK